MTEVLHSKKDQLGDIGTEIVAADSAAEDETQINLLDMPVEVINTLLNILVYRTIFFSLV